MTNGAKRTSPWIYVALGCLGAVVAAVVVVVGLGVWGAKKMADFGEAMADPKQQEEQVLNILGLETIPVGYHALMGVRIPFLMELAMLTDLEPREDDMQSSFDTHGFIYANFLQPDENQRQKLTAFFDGTTDDLDALRDHGYQLDIEERLSHGALEFDDRRLLWVATRSNFRGDGEFKRSGLANIILVHCEDEDSRQRMAVWFGPLPPNVSSGASASDAADATDSITLANESYSPEQLRGTVGDPTELENFVGAMNLCSSS